MAKNPSKSMLSLHYKHFGNKEQSNKYPWPYIYLKVSPSEPKKNNNNHYQVLRYHTYIHTTTIQLQQNTLGEKEEKKGRGNGRKSSIVGGIKGKFMVIRCCTCLSRQLMFVGVGHLYPRTSREFRLLPKKQGLVKLYLSNKNIHDKSMNRFSIITYWSNKYTLQSNCIYSIHCCRHMGTWTLQEYYY